MRNLLKKNYKKLTEIFFKFLYGNISIDNSKNSKLISKIKVTNEFFEKKNYFIYSITNGSVFTDNTENVAAISNSKLLGEFSFQHGNSKIISAKNNSVLKKGLTNFQKKYHGNVLSLVQGASTENYFHWLMDILPKIRIFTSKYSINKIDYLYVGSLTSSQEESLKFLGIKKKQIIKSKIYKHINAKKLFFVTHPWYFKGKFHDQSHNLPKWQIIWIKETFLKFKKKFKINKNIYIDRSESKFSHCQIINHLELKKYLKKKKFEIVKLASQSFAKQIYMFWNANCIIGAHGAALTNLVFSKPKTKVIELKPFRHPGKNYQRISKVNNLHYYSIESERKYLKNKNGDIFVDLKKLDRKINL
jgi:hypothetical protein